MAFKDTPLLRPRLIPEGTIQDPEWAQLRFRNLAKCCSEYKILLAHKDKLQCNIHIIQDELREGRYENDSVLSSLSQDEERFRLDLEYTQARINYYEADPEMADQAHLQNLKREINLAARKLDLHDAKRLESVDHDHVAFLEGDIRRLQNDGG